jgi:hypothetical protein
MKKSSSIAYALAASFIAAPMVLADEAAVRKSLAKMPFRFSGKLSAVRIELE